MKRSISLILAFCAVSIKLSSVLIARSTKEEYAGIRQVVDHRPLNPTVGRRQIIEYQWRNTSQDEVLIMSSATNHRSEQKNITEKATELLLNTQNINKAGDLDQDQSNNTVTTSNRNTPRHIWIDAITYAEGIAGWKTSLLELLYLAQTLGATLVEPCMTSGRIGSCGDNYTIPVSEIFDLAKYMEPSSGREFPSMSSFENYQNALDESESEIGMVKMCLLGDPRLPIDTRCAADVPLIRDMEKNTTRLILDKSNEDNFILHFEDYWRGSLGKLGKQLGMEFPGITKEFESQIIPFHSKHLQFVDGLLQRANLTSDNFSVIHWRAEKAGMNFTRCARAVNNAKRIMLTNMSNSTVKMEEEGLRQHKFVLLSSLNEDADKMWKVSKAIAAEDWESVRNALQYLLRDNGFIKIDDLLDEEQHILHDSGMLAIYDLIIATKANNFATCIRRGEIGCSEFALQSCEECNRVGKFGHLATLFRQQSVVTVGSTWACWPTE